MCRRAPCRVANLTRGADETSGRASMSRPRRFRPRFRPAPALGLLRRNRDFRLAFVAQLISFAGDWFLFVALAGLVFSLTRSAGLVAALIVAGTVPSALFTFVGGPLADRFNRQVLMVVADVVRG